jgi:hypothetical protein
MRWETLVVIDTTAEWTIDNRKAKRHLHGLAWIARSTTTRAAARCEATLFPGVNRGAPRPVYVRCLIRRPPRPLSMVARARLLDAGHPSIENVCGWVEWPFGLPESAVTSTRTKIAILAGFRYAVFRRSEGDQFPNTVRVNLPRSTATLFFHRTKGIRAYCTGACSKAAFEQDTVFMRTLLEGWAVLPLLRAAPTRAVSTILAVRQLARPVTAAVARQASQQGNGHRDVINLRYVPFGDRTGCGMTCGRRRVTLYGCVTVEGVARLSRQLDAFVARAVRSASTGTKRGRPRAAGGGPRPAVVAVAAGTMAWRRRQVRAGRVSVDGSAFTTFRHAKCRHSKPSKVKFLP